MPENTRVQRAFELARERYAELGVDVASAVARLAEVPLSLHCWQGDDVGGFERPDASLSGGGIQVTGGHPGKARTADELRQDMAAAFALIPGRHRVNLHAMYGEFGERPVERDEIGLEHYRGWIDWAKGHQLGLDFNATCFSHPKADSGFTLSHKDPSIRKFWMRHVKRCRTISAEIGRELGTPCLHNLWVPDGSKDLPADRWGHRGLLKDSLDEIFAVDCPAEEMKDALESKLFGLGSEAFVVGSHEFYLGYALSRGKMICLDMGHFHPTESVPDKVSAVLQFSKELLLHISRGVRWDSDHVPLFDDEVATLMREVVRGGALDRVHLALDFFDASIDRVGAWVIGARSVRKALLLALLEPHDRLKQMEEVGDGFARLALMEEAKTLPFGAVWEHYCATAGVPTGEALRDAVRAYARDVTSKR